MTKNYQKEKLQESSLKNEVFTNSLKEIVNNKQVELSLIDEVWCAPKQYTDLSNHASLRRFNRWLAKWKEMKTLPTKGHFYDPRELWNLEQKGILLAQSRAEVLESIISNDPQKAIQVALSQQVSSSLPQSISKHIEKWENAIADISAMHVCFDPKHPNGLIKRFAKFNNDRTLEAFVYGERKNIFASKGISLWGVSLNGKLAMSDQSYQLHRDPNSGKTVILHGGRELTFKDHIDLKLFDYEVKQSERNAQLSRTRVNYPVIAASTSITDYYNKKYDLIDTPMAWADANQTAFNLNGRLVSIGSEQEQNFIYKLFKTASRGTTTGGSSVPYGWIGATDNEDQNGSTYNQDGNISSGMEINATEGDWKWLSGDDVNGTYSNWLNATEPNNTDNPDQDYAVLDWSTSDGSWKDVNSSYRLPFVIEYGDSELPSGTSVAADGFRKVLIVPARFIDEGINYDPSSSPLADRQGNINGGQVDSFEPVTPENLANAMQDVKEFFLRNSDGTFHLEPVISPTVTLQQIHKYDKARGSGEPNLFDTNGSYFSADEIEHPELSTDPLESPIGESAIWHAADLGEDWNFNGPAFQGISSITLNTNLVGGGFTAPPIISFSGGNVDITGQVDSRFKSAKAEAIVNADGNITGIRILDSGAYYQGTPPRILLNGSDALSDQFTITVQNICISWVVISTHSPGAAGLGWVGAPGSHVDAGPGGTISAKVITHELGHNFGLLHANRFITRGEKPNSDEGTLVDYGNPYSVMGSYKDIQKGGDFTIPAKVATNSNSGFGLTIGEALGFDVLEVPSALSLNSSPHDESINNSDVINPNTFHIYRHDYGSAPLPLQVAEFSVSIPSQELDTLTSGQIYALEFNGTGEGADGILSIKDGNWTLTITRAGKGYSESPLVKILDENNATIMSLEPAWIRVAAGTQETIQADLRDYSITAHRGLRGVEIQSSQYSPLGESGENLSAYWLSYRHSASPHGLTVINGSVHDQGRTIENFLLDMTPNTPGDFTDAFLMPGHTFSDYEADTHITPIGKGGVFPMEYLKVVLNMGTVEGGHSGAPEFSVKTNTRTPAVGEKVEITAEVSDGNTSGYAYGWFTDEKMESDITVLNKPTIYKSFENVGTTVVRVVVSDMKGGISSQNIVFKVGEYEKSKLSSISGSVRSKDGFIQGARVILQKAPIIEHKVTVQGNERDWYYPNGNNNPLKYNIDGMDSPRLVLRKGEIHRFHFDTSTEGFPMSFFEEPENESSRVKINMMVTPVVDDRASGFIESVDVNVSGGSSFSSYTSHTVGTIDDYQKGKMGIIDQPLIVTRPYAKVLLQDSNVTNIVVRPIMKDEEGQFVSYGGVGHDRNNPPNVSIKRSSLWENYNDLNATAIAYVDGVGTISPASAINFLSGIWQNRAENDPIPELVVWGTGSGANAIVETYNRPNNNKPHRQIVVHDQGVGFDPNGTMAVLHYPLDPLMSFSFDRHESLYEESDDARFQPSPAWNKLVTNQLLHYWKFDEVNGAVIFDQAPNGNVNLNIAELSEANRSQWGTKGRAVNFIGNTDPITLNGGDTMLPSPPYTLSVWLNPDENRSFEFDGGFGATNLVSTHTSPGKRDFTYNGVTIERSTIHNPWVHVAIVALSNPTGSGFLYVDGNRIAITGISALGGQFLPEQSFGLMDEMHIYSKAMSETEVRRMAGRLFLDLSGNKLHAVPIGSDFNMSAPSLAGMNYHGSDLGVSFERPGIGDSPKVGNSNLGDTFPGENHGNSIYFDDNDSYIDLGNNIDSFAGLNEGSISFWLRTPGVDESGNYADFTILSASDSDDNESYFRLMVRDIGVMQLHVVNDGTEVAKFYTQQSSKVRYEGVPEQKDWHHVVLVVDANKSVFWVDGKQANSIVYSSGSGNNRAFFSDIENMDTFTIGLHRTAEENATNSYRGWLDDFNFYDRPITSAEINYLYNLRKGKEQLPRLEAVVDSIGTVEVLLNGEGYKETPDVFFSYGQEGNLTDELLSYTTEDDLFNETNTTILTHGKLAFTEDTNLVYSYHYVRDDTDTSWRYLSTNNGWREYSLAFGKGELNATGVDRVLWTKDTERLSTYQLPDNRNVSHRYLEYVVAENGNYVPPYGLFGFVSPPEVIIGASSTNQNASAYTLFFIDQNNSAEIVNPGRGFDLINGDGFNKNSVRVSGPGFRPQQINRVQITDIFGNPENVDVISVQEEEYQTNNQLELPSIIPGESLESGKNDQHVFVDWATGDPTHYVRNDDLNTDFNKTLSHVATNEVGAGYSMPVSISLVGGYPKSDDLLGWIMDGNLGEYPFTPAQIEVNSIDENGTILDFNIVHPGRGYTIVPEVVITGGGGYGARAIVDIDLNGVGEVTNIGLDPEVTDPGGRGYFNIDSSNVPTASLDHTSPLDPNERDANLSLRLGGSLQEIPTCGGCRSGAHVALKNGTHTEVWVEIWDKKRTEVEIDNNGDRASAVAKVKNGKIEKVIVVESGFGYQEPVIFVRGAGSKHMNYLSRGKYELREWRCVNLRENKTGNLVECGHIHRGMYPPEQCTGEVDTTFPVTAEESANAINEWKGRHLKVENHLCDHSDYNATTHLNAGFKSRVCSGTKVNFVLINDIYRRPYEKWVEFDANLSALVTNGRISEILVHNQGSMYASSEVHVFGSGGGVDAIPVFNDAGLNTHVIFDDPKLKNLETGAVNYPIGAGHGFQERPWSWDMLNETDTTSYTPTFGTREKVHSFSVTSSLVDPETAFGEPILNDNLGDRLNGILVRDFGLFLSDRNVTDVDIDFNGTHRPDVNGDGFPDFFEASAMAFTTTRLTKIYFDNNGTYFDDKNNNDPLDDRWKSLFTAQPVVNIIDELENVSVLGNNKSTFLRLNGFVDYDPVAELGYLDLYVDDRLPGQFFYGFKDPGNPDLPNGTPSMGGEIIITEGLPGMNWALNEPNERNTTVYTDSNGFYSLPNLEPGLYNIAVLMEDEYFQESTFRSDGNGSSVTEVLYVPGIPELTLETDGLGMGNSRLIWSADSRLLSRPNSSEKKLEGIGAGFRIGDTPQLTIVPDSANLSSAPPKLITSVLFDGTLSIEIIDDVNTTAFYPNDRFTLYYSSTISGVDFREDYQYSRSKNSSWAGTLSAPNRGIPRLEIFPNDGYGTNSIEVPVSSIGVGDQNFTFRARAYDGIGNQLTTEGLTWSLELDFNSSEGSNTNVASLKSPQYYIYGDDGVNGQGYYYPVYLTNEGLGTHHPHIIDGKTVYMEDGNPTVHRHSTLPVSADLLPFPVDFNKTREINLILRSTLQMGRVDSVSVFSPGTNYSSNSQLLVKGEGNDFNGSLIVDGTGKVLDVNISNGGSGHNSNSQIQILDINGSGGLLSPTLGGGSLYLVASMDYGGTDLTARVKVVASPRTQLSSQEKWLNRYLDSTLDRNSTWWSDDLDNDGLSNFQEWSLSTNPYQSDTDGDGLSDLAEDGNFTNALQPDTDGDGLNDYLELTSYLTNPLLFDSDQDGWSDGHEVSLAMDPTQKEVEDIGFLSGIFINQTSLENNVSSYIELNNSLGTYYKKINLGATNRFPQYFYQASLPPQAYTITAFIDRNGNGSYSAGEPFGQWDGNVSDSTALVRLPVLDPKPSIQFGPNVDENVTMNPGPEQEFLSFVVAEDTYEGILAANQITITGNATEILDFNSTTIGEVSVRPDAAPGNYVLNYQATDSLGTQSDVITQNITVSDVSSPTLILFTDNNPVLEAGDVYVEPGFYAVDNVDGVLTADVNYTENFESNETGIHDLNYTVEDSANNVTSKKRSVTVVDTTSPVLTLNGSPNIVLEFGDSYVDSNASWVDIVDGSGQVSPNEVLDLNTTGVQLLTFTKIDDNNNTSNVVTRSVTITDTTSPTIVLNGNALIAHEAGQTFIDQGASWNDLADGNGTIYSQNTVNISTPSIQHIAYMYTDQSGNDSNVLTRVVQIVDTTAPILQLIGDSNVTSEVGFSYQDQGAIWTDTVDGNGTVQSTGTVNVQVLGDYNLTYSYSDQAGNPGIDLNRTVHIRDTISPTISFSQDEFPPFNVGDEISFPGVIAIDLYDGNVTSNMTVSEPVGFDSNQTGTYQFTFTANDSSGNITTVQKNIQIVNNTVVVNGLAIDGYLSGARVIFDMNGDGLSDLSQETFTNSKGTFSLLFTMDEFISVDKNENGLLDSHEGSIIVQGGIDTSTNLPFEGSIISDANSSVVSPLTSLSHALMKIGKTKPEAESMVLKTLDISESIDLSNYDPLAALENGDEQAVHVLRQSTMLANMIKHAGAFANFLEPNDNHSRSVGLILMNEIAKDIAGGVTDIFALENLENNLRKTVEKLDIASNMTAEDLTVASTLIRDSNEAISSSSDDTLNDGFGAVGVFKIQSAIDDLILSNYPVDRNGSLIIVQQLASTQNLFGSSSVQKVENIFAPIGSSFTISVTGEDWKNGALHEVNASDPEGGVVNYSIIAGNQDFDLDGNNTFSLSESGKLIVQDQDDFLLQADQTINLTILLSDSDGKQSFVTGQLELGSAEVLNPVEEPTEIEPENIAPIGSSFTISVTGEDWKNGALHEVNASDPEGGMVYYSIIAGNQDFDLDGSKTFSLSESGKLIVKDQDDFLLQADQTINLTILLSDSDGKQSFVTGQLELASAEVLNPVEEPTEIEPENIAPIGSSFNISITGEDWKNGALYEVNASDPEGGVVYYSIIAGNQDFDLDGNKTFSLSESGKLSVRDHEDFISQANQSISLNISLSDSDGKQGVITGQLQLGNSLVLNSIKSSNNSAWYSSDWLGYFYSSEGQWLYHNQLEWLFIQQDIINEGYWVWDSQKMIWWWTRPGIFPFFYNPEVRGWHYFNLQNNPILFYNYQTASWKSR